MTPGVGTGEFARLVPRGPTELGGGGGALGDNAGASERKGDSEKGKAEVEAGARRPQKQQEQHQQLLEDLVPPVGKNSVPGTGVPFVVDSDETPEGLGSAGGSADVGGGGRVGGAGRALSVFEAKALQKARARQRDRMAAGEPQVEEESHNKRVSGVASLQLFSFFLPSLACNLIGTRKRSQGMETREESDSAVF